MHGAATKADPNGLVKAVLLDAWNAGVELELYRELASSAREAEGLILDGDCAGAREELVVALDRLEFGMTTLG